MKILILLIVFGITGCVLKKKSNSEIPLQNQSQMFVHRISNLGENLSIIALWYTGDEHNWRKCYIPSVANSVRKLQPGDEILLPLSLITNFEPLTLKFINLHRPKRVPIARAAPKQTEENSEPEVVATNDDRAEEVTTSDLEAEFLHKMVPTAEAEQ